MADTEAPTEATPLVSSDGTEVVNDTPAPLKEMKEQSLREELVTAFATATFGVSVASMVMVSNPSVYVSGAIGAGLSPLAALQQTKLTQCEALRQTNQRIESEVAILGAENERLKGQVGQLEASVEHLKELQTTLNTVQVLEGDSIDELEKQVEESEKILNAMQDNLSGDVIQTLISVIMAINTDGDNEMSDSEIDMLMEKVEHLHGVDVNEEKLRTKLIENGRSISAVMSVIKNLLDNDLPPEENIFNFIHSDETAEAE